MITFFFFFFKTGRTALGLTSSNEIARLLKNHV